MPVLERLSPFRDLDLVERRMRRLFADLPAVPGIPAADLYETEKEFVLELEVPGFEESELDVEVSDHALTVKGARNAETEKRQKAVRLHERLEATFERSFTLPVEADSEHLTAAFGKGVLTVHVPKTATMKARRIEIAKA